MTRKVVLIGWDAADWQILHPLLDAGRMPNLQKLVESGTSGTLQTLHPPLSPMLWTSIATGRSAIDHGILGFSEPDPISGGVRPASSESRRVKALWNILEQSGLSANVVNWFASHPAEPGRGIIVSDAFASIASSRIEPPENLPQGIVYPSTLQQTFADLMVFPNDLSGNDLAMFISNLDRIDQQTDKRPLALARQLAQTFTAHAAFTWILEHHDWNFAAVYYDLIDRAGHYFMPFHPPQMEGTSDSDFACYRNVMNAVYECQDALLGRAMHLAGPDAVVMVVSDHGFVSGNQRPNATAGPEAWHREHGIFCVGGPAIRKDELAFGATLLDIAPTILSLFGLPAAANMPGRVLVEIFEAPPSLERVETYEDTEERKSAAETLTESWDGAAMFDQLAALGYVDNRGENEKDVLEKTRMDQTFNLARALMANGNAEAAVPLLQEIRQSAEDRARQNSGEDVREDLDIAVAWGCLRAGRMQEAREIAERLLQTGGDRPAANLILAETAILQGRGEEALAYAEAVRASSVNASHVLEGRVGRAFLLMGRWDDAEKCFREGISRWPEIGSFHRGLAIALNGQKRWRDAAAAALEAVGADYSSPAGHFLLGRALIEIGAIERAVQAFEVCLRLQPDHQGAQHILARIRQRAARVALDPA